MPHDDINRIPPVDANVECWCDSNMTPCFECFKTGRRHIVKGR